MSGNSNSDEATTNYNFETITPAPQDSPVDRQKITKII